MELWLYFAITTAFTGVFYLAAFREWQVRSGLIGVIIIGFTSGIQRVGPHIIPLRDEHYYFEVVIQTYKYGFLPFQPDPIRWINPSRFANHPAYHLLTVIQTNVYGFELETARIWIPVITGIGIFIAAIWLLNQLVKTKWAMVGSLMITSLGAVRGYYIQYHPQSFAILVTLVLGGCIIKTYQTKLRHYQLLVGLMLVVLLLSHRFSPILLLIVFSLAFFIDRISHLIIRHSSRLKRPTVDSQTGTGGSIIFLFGAFGIATVTYSLWVDEFFSRNVLSTILIHLSGDIPPPTSFAGAKSTPTIISTASRVLKAVLVILASFTVFRLFRGELDRYWWGILSVGAAFALLTVPILLMGLGATPRFIIGMLIILVILSIPALQTIYEKSPVAGPAIVNILVVGIVLLGVVGGTVPIYVDADSTLSHPKAAFPETEPLSEDAKVGGEFLCAHSPSESPLNVGVGYYTFAVAGPFGCSKPIPYGDVQNAWVYVYDIARPPKTPKTKSKYYTNGRIIVVSSF